MVGNSRRCRWHWEPLLVCFCFGQLALGGRSRRQSRQIFLAALRRCPCFSMLHVTQPALLIISRACYIEKGEALHSVIHLPCVAPPGKFPDSNREGPISLYRRLEFDA